MKKVNIAIIGTRDSDVVNNNKMGRAIRDYLLANQLEVVNVYSGNAEGTDQVANLFRRVAKVTHFLPWDSHNADLRKDGVEYINKGTSKDYDDLMFKLYPHLAKTQKHAILKLIRRNMHIILGDKDHKAVDIVFWHTKSGEPVSGTLYGYTLAKHLGLRTVRLHSNSPEEAATVKVEQEVSKVVEKKEEDKKAPQLLLSGGSLESEQLRSILASGVIKGLGLGDMYYKLIKNKAVIKIGKVQVDLNVNIKSTSVMLKLSGKKYVTLDIPHPQTQEETAMWLEIVKDYIVRLVTKANENAQAFIDKGELVYTINKDGKIAK